MVSSRSGVSDLLAIERRPFADEDDEAEVRRATAQQASLKGGRRSIPSIRTSLHPDVLTKPVF